jgi:hypothetical protein
VRSEAASYSTIVTSLAGLSVFGCLLVRPFADLTSVRNLSYTSSDQQIVCHLKERFQGADPKTGERGCRTLVHQMRCNSEAGTAEASAPAPVVLPSSRTPRLRAQPARLVEWEGELTVHARPTGVLAVVLSALFVLTSARASTAVSARSTSTAPLVLTLKSGNGATGQRDARVWVRGAADLLLGVTNSGLGLQRPFISPTPQSSSPVERASWISPSLAGRGPAEGYEYFVLFQLPTSVSSVVLDAVWRADDAALLAINGTQMSVLGDFPRIIYRGHSTRTSRSSCGRAQIG